MHVSCQAGGSKSWRTGNVIKIKRVKGGKEAGRVAPRRQTDSLSNFRGGKGGKISFWISKREEERGSTYYADPTEEEGGGAVL